MNLFRKLKRFNYVLDILFMVAIFYLYISFTNHKSSQIEYLILDNEIFEEIIDFEGFDNKNGVERHIIPNIIHYLIRNQTELNLTNFISILSVYYYQKPRKIYVHSDKLKINNEIQQLIKKFKLNKIIEIKQNNQNVTKIFNNEVKFKEHLDDFKRLEILMHYGGIFINENAILAQSLDSFRTYEAVLALDENDLFDNIVMIAHKNSRILKAFYDGYRTNFTSSELNFNLKIHPRNLIRNYVYLSKTTKLKQIEDQKYLKELNSHDSIKLWSDASRFIKIFNNLINLNDDLS